MGGMACILMPEDLQGLRCRGERGKHRAPEPIALSEGLKAAWKLERNQTQIYGNIHRIHLTQDSSTSIEHNVKIVNT